MDEFRFEITEEMEDERIDKCLSMLIDSLSRSYIQKLIKDIYSKKIYFIHFKNYDELSELGASIIAKLIKEKPTPAHRKPFNV